MEFGIQSTQLPDAGVNQGSVGQDVVAPVSERYVASNALENIGNMATIFAKGLGIHNKEEADKQKNAIVGSYIREQQLINDGVASGEISPDRAATRGRALFGKYGAGYPAFMNDLHEANTALRGGSEMGATEDAVKSAADERKARMAAARADGITLEPWMSSETQDVLLRNHEADVRSRKSFDDLVKRSAEGRAQNSEGRAVFSAEQAAKDREIKEAGTRTIVELASSNLDSSYAFIKDIQSNVSQGAITREAAQMKITQYFSTIEGTIQAAASVNPELAAPYRTLFGDLKKLGMDNADPTKSAESSKAAYEEIINRGKLLAVTSDPAMKAVVVANSLLGGNAITALGSMKPITDWIAKASTVDATVDPSAYVPQIVGVPDAEKATTDFLVPALKKLNANGYADNEKAGREAVSVVNNVLKQVGDLGNNPNVKQDPVKLINLAKMFASDDYGRFASSGKLSTEAAQAAKQVWQTQYDPVVSQSIQKRMDTWAAQASAEGGGVSGYKLSDAIDIKFTGAGVQFNSKVGDKSLEPFQQLQQKAGIKDLQAAQGALNQLIHIGAHLEGTTNYQKYWEENRHTYIPQLYARPGVVVNGYKSKGGLINDSSNWTKVE